MLYKVGDRVKLIDGTENLPHWVSRMSWYANKVVTIAELNGYRDRFYVKERPPNIPDKFYFEPSDIVGFEDPEMEAKRLEEEREATKDCIYSVEEVREIAREVFGKERVESHKHPNSFEIVIHFPEIEIRNSAGRTHIIKNLFVEVRVSDINLSETCKAQIEIRGFRTSFELGEITCNYSHSHLTTVGIGSPQTFCLGSGDLQVTISSVEMSLSEEDWYLFFYSLDRYVRWESTEGGPHISMERIGFKKTIERPKVARELAKIIDNAPMEIWGLTEGLMLKDSHPSFTEFLSKHSSFKNLGSFSVEEVEKAKKAGRTKLPVKPFKFGKKEFEYEVTSENTIPNQEGHISRVLLDEYKTIINNDLKSFSKRLEYERRKQDGKVTINLQAEGSSNTKTAESNQLSAF